MEHEVPPVAVVVDVGLGSELPRCRRVFAGSLNNPESCSGQENRTLWVFFGD